MPKSMKKKKQPTGQQPADGNQTVGILILHPSEGLTTEINLISVF